MLCRLSYPGTGRAAEGARPIVGRHRTASTRVPQRPAARPGMRRDRGVSSAARRSIPPRREARCSASTSATPTSSRSLALLRSRSAARPAAAVTLPRDSVGRPQIRTDAGQPAGDREGRRRARREIRARGRAELRRSRTTSIQLADRRRRRAQCAGGHEPACGSPSESADVGECVALTTCSNLASVSLGSGNWLVQAKFTLVGSPFGLADRCGLVKGALFDPEVVDEASSVGLDIFIGSERSRSRMWCRRAGSRPSRCAAPRTPMRS